MQFLLVMSFVVCIQVFGTTAFATHSFSPSIQAPARVLSVYDGDTVRVEAAMWPGLTWTGSVRVEGVDTPEIRGKCEEEKRKAVAAREFVRQRVGKRVVLVNVKKGKYAGRVVARVRLADGSDLTELLIQAKLGRPYTGGRRQGWCR